MIRDVMHKVYLKKKKIYVDVYLKDPEILITRYIIHKDDQLTLDTVGEVKFNIPIIKDFS